MKLKKKTMKKACFKKSKGLIMRIKCIFYNLRGLPSSF